MWGFDDLTAGDGGTSDATTPVADQSVGSEGGGGDDGAADSALVGDGSGSDAADVGLYGEAGDGGEIADTGVRDAADDAAILCKSICPMGCCDSKGHCQTGNTTALCGIGGNACQVCPTSACTLSSPCCGMTSKQCGCAAAGLLCSQN